MHEINWNKFLNYSKNTTTSDFDIGLFFIYGDESIPNHAKDYSIVFPIQHVANGLSLNFKPNPEPAHNSHWIELVHPDWFSKSKEDHRNGKNVLHTLDGNNLLIFSWFITKKIMMKKSELKFSKYRIRALKSRGSYRNSALFLKRSQYINLDFHVLRKSQKAKCGS